VEVTGLVRVLFAISQFPFFISENHHKRNNKTQSTDNTMIFHPSFSATIASSLLAAHLAYPGVDAHGYLKTPRSRNYRASIDPKYFGG